MNYVELHNLYPSPDVIKVIKWRRIMWEWECNRHGKYEK